MPFVVVDINNKIVFSDDTFRHYFNVNENALLNEINSEPKLEQVLSIVSNQNLAHFEFEIYSGDNVKWMTDVEQILLNGDKYFLLNFSSTEFSNQIQGKLHLMIQALETGNIPVLIIDGENKINYLTASFEKLLDLQLEDAYNKSILEINPDTLSEHQIIELRNLIKSGKCWQKIFAVKFKGNTRYIDFSFNPVHFNEESQYSILTANDVTELVINQKTITRENQRLELILQNISDLLIIIRRKGADLFIENANKNFAEIFFIASTFYQGVNIEECISFEMLGTLKQIISEKDTLNSSLSEFQFRNSKSRFYKGKISSFDDPLNGDLLYIICLFDLTEQQQYQERQKKLLEKEKYLNKLKEALLANLSHEIRTPLTAISGYSEILEDCIKQKDFNSVYEITDSIKDIMKRILSLFTNVVEVAQIESGEILIEKETVNCNKILRSVYCKKIADAKVKGLDLILDLDINDVLVNTDFSKLEKVIFVLVDNAIKYTPNGNIRLRTENTSDGVNIIISDNGLGMDHNQINKLLTPFIQEEDTYRRNIEGGAGLGLALAHKLTYLIGGKFSIYSKKFLGTKVVLTFPFSDTISKDDYNSFRF